MARYVHEIMNRKVLSVDGATSAREALGQLTKHGVSSAPVLHGNRVVLGVVSVTDLTGQLAGEAVSDRMSAPAVVVKQDATIRAAADLLAETGLHHAPVVGDDGKVVGMISVVDVLRAVLGKPTPHPDTFSRFDPMTGVTWTHERELTPENAGEAPEGAGVVMVLEGGADRVETIVWAESVSKIRTRLREVLAIDRFQATSAVRYRFRAARVDDPEMRRAALLGLSGMLRKP